MFYQKKKMYIIHKLKKKVQLSILMPWSHYNCDQQCSGPRGFSLLSHSIGIGYGVTEKSDLFQICVDACLGERLCNLVLDRKFREV